MKFKTQLTVHNSSFLTVARTPLTTTRKLNVMGSLTQACSLQQQSHSLLQVLLVSNSQTYIPKHTLLFVDHTYSLQRESNLAIVSAYSLLINSIIKQNSLTVKLLHYKSCFFVDIKLHLPQVLRILLLSPVKCSTP